MRLSNAGKRAYFNRVVIGYDLVVLTIALCSDPDMRSGLPSCLISNRFQRLYEAFAVNVPRQLHRASTSSRTK